MISLGRCALKCDPSDWPAGCARPAVADSQSIASVLANFFGQSDGSAAFESLAAESLPALWRPTPKAIRLGGGPAAIERQHAKGRLTARERIGRLLDPGTPWLELGLWAGWQMYCRVGRGAGGRGGVRRGHGRRPAAHDHRQRRHGESRGLLSRPRPRKCCAPSGSPCRTGCR